MKIERIKITNRAQWLALRARDLTASDLAAVAGVDPRRSALQVYAEKTGLVPPTADNNLMRRGRWLEAAVIEALREEYPTWDIRRADVYLRAPDHRLGATPDAVAIDPSKPDEIINIQCKVVSRPVFDRDWSDDEAPIYYQVQTVAEGLLTAAARSIVAALIIDTFTADLTIRDVPRHAGAEVRVVRTANEFWAMIDAGRQPSPDYRIDADVIDALYPVRHGETVDLTGDNRMPELLEQRATAKAEIKSAQAVIDQAEAEIRHKIGSADEAIVPGWRVTNREQSRNEFIVPANRFRVLRVTDRRAKEDTNGPF